MWLVWVNRLESFWLSSRASDLVATATPLGLVIMNNILPTMWWRNKIYVHRCDQKGGGFLCFFFFSSFIVNSSNPKYHLSILSLFCPYCNPPNLPPSHLSNELNYSRISSRPPSPPDSARPRRARPPRRLHGPSGAAVPLPMPPFILVLHRKYELTATVFLVDAAACGDG